MTEEEIRRIVREELAAQREGVIAAAEQHVRTRITQAIQRVWGEPEDSNHPQTPEVSRD